MKKLLLLAVLSTIAALMLAPAALAQISPAPGNTGPYGCPEEAPIVATIAGDPGEGSLQCFATEEEAAAYRASGGTPQEEPEQYAPPTTTTPTATEQYTPPTTTTAPTATTATATGLPDTGGPALLLPAAGLLLVAGLVVDMRVARRRS